MGLHKKPQTEKNLSLYDIGWTSSKRVFPSGDIEKVVFSGVIPDNLLSLDGIDSFRDDFAEHEIKVFLDYLPSDLPYDSEFKIYSTKIRYEGFEEVVSSQGELDLVTTGSTASLASGTIDLFLHSDPVVRNLPLFLRAKDGITGLGETGDSLVTGTGTVGTNNFMTMFVLGAIETATMNLFTKNVAPPATSKIGTSNLVTEGGKNVLPFKFNDMSLFIKDLISGSGTPNSSMNLAMPSVGSATIEDRRLLFVKGVVPEKSSSSTLYLRVNEEDLKTLRLRLQGPPYYKASGDMNLFLKVHEPVFSVTGKLGRKLDGQGDTYGLDPAILQNKNISLVTSGRAVSNSSLEMLIPNVMGSGTINKFLYISGKPSGSL